MPPDAKFPKLRQPVTITFGKPIDVSRYADRASDHLVLRQIIDEVMYEIRELSGQEYVNEYAGKKKAVESAESAATDLRAPAREQTRAEQVASVEASSAAGAAVGRTVVNGSRSTNGATAPSDAASGVSTTAPGDDGATPDASSEDTAFAAATQPRSSAEVLRRPVRRGI